MSQIRFQIQEYELLSQSMSAPNLGDLSIIDLTGEPLAGHGTLEYRLRVHTSPWVKLPAEGVAEATQSGTTFTYRMNKPVSRDFFNHIYLICQNEKPVTVEVDTSDTIVPFEDGAGNQRANITNLRFRTGPEPAGEGSEGLQELINRLTEGQL